MRRLPRQTISRRNAVANFAVCAVGLPIAVLSGNPLAATLLLIALVGTAVLVRNSRRT